MSNTLLTIDMITRKALEVLENSLVITRNINRQYDPSFAVEGAKIGSTLRVRKPVRYTVSTGAALAVQDVTEDYTTLSVATQAQVAMNFTTAEMTMNLDDFNEKIIHPAISQMASYIDADVANVYKDVWQSVGTAGTTPATSLVLLQGQQKLNEAAANANPRYATVNPAANASLVEGMKGLFNPGSVIDRQFKSGMMGADVLGYSEIAMSQSIKQFTPGTRAGAHTVTTTVSTQGDTTLDITGSGSETLAIGDVFTVANVYAVNPQTRESTGSLQQFVVTAANTASGGAYSNVAIQPPMYTSGQQLATIDAFPVSGAVVTFIGSTAVQYPQNLIYHKDAFTMATADLLMPNNVDMASRQVHNGISMRIVRDYDINNDRMPCRVDVLYGYKAIRPEMAVRLWG